MVVTSPALKEHVELLGRTQPVVAIVTDPIESPDDAAPIGVIISNSGIVHRVGPGRLYVKIARLLAGMGFTAVRIDHSGIGDSDPRRDKRPFADAALDEIREVMDDLAVQRGIERFVVTGICSGAFVALQAAFADDRVIGAAMINGGPQTANVEFTRQVLNRKWARTYWRRSLFSLDSWRRALTGQIEYRELAGVLRRQVRGMLGRSEAIASTATSFATNVRATLERGTWLLFVHAEDDHSVDFLDAVLGKDLGAMQASGRFGNEIVSRTDHTFTLARNQRDLLAVLEPWARRVRSG